MQTVEECLARLRRAWAYETSADRGQQEQQQQAPSSLGPNLESAVEGGGDGSQSVALSGDPQSPGLQRRGQGRRSAGPRNKKLASRFASN